MKNINNSYLFLLLLVQGIIYGQFANVAPVLTATGDEFYCIGSSTKIVTNMIITDPDDTGIDAIYIQISSGYVFGQDTLSLTGIHPTIISNWDSLSGKLTLSGATPTQPTYIELVAAIKDVEFSNSSPNPSGSRKFSITVGQANYLPSNGHYYQYIPNIGVTWTTAKSLAQASTYYGLQGYLATITAADESQLAGEQASGAGWIGGSDEETEGTWKWMTGPELGTVFWIGGVNGSTTTYAKWNTGEPNNQGDEDYAHITAPGVGNIGSWNDLSNTGATSGNYQPKGYIVEYGGMPGDPVLQISTSSTLTIPSISNTVTATRCGTGAVTLQATSNTGIVNWYDAPNGGNLLGTGNSFATPSISSDTIFYAVAHSANCPDYFRVPITAFVTQLPVVSVDPIYYMCDENPITINATISVGFLNWYDSLTATAPIYSGTNFVIPNIHQDTTYYVEGNNNGCLSNRIAVLIKVYQLPNVSDENIELCEGNTIVLNAGISGMTYLWSNGATTQTILSDSLSSYSVIITTPSPENCSKTKHFYIIYNLSPMISDIMISDSNATIVTTQSGDYDYSVDGINYQSSPIFTVLEGGIYTAYVREKNGCGETSKTFAIITYPEFFTPNGDNYNDVWTVKGLSYFPDATIQLFDRFGKLIAVLNSKNSSWNGTLNGVLLPASDYWFISKIDNSIPEKRGHFSLKR